MVILFILITAQKAAFRSRQNSKFQTCGSAFSVFKSLFKLKLGLFLIFANGYTVILSAIMQLQNNTENYHFVF